MSLTTLPTRVEDEIEIFMNKDQLKTFEVLRDVFRQAVLDHFKQKPKRILNMRIQGPFENLKKIPFWSRRKVCDPEIKI